MTIVMDWDRKKCIDVFNTRLFEENIILHFDKFSWYIKKLY